MLVTALSTDADNLYVTLTARSMAPGLFIVSRAASEAAVGKLVQAGADRVVNPQDLGGAPGWPPWPRSPWSAGQWILPY